MAPIVQKVPGIPRLVVGEGPHWDVATQSLYFVDAGDKAIHKYVPSTGEHSKVVFDSMVTVVIPVKDKKNQFIVNLEKEVSIMTWDGKSEKPSKIEKLVEIKDPLAILGDGKCDSRGVYWTGTLGPIDHKTHAISTGHGSLFSFSKGNQKYYFQGTGLSNGMAWDEKLRKFYYIDSCLYRIDAFDYDLDTATISNRTTVFSSSKHDIEELPDGMTIDVDGNLWVAYFAGGRVIKIDSKKPDTLLETVHLPAKLVTSVTWGGANLDVLYATTGSIPLKGEPFLGPEHGAIYAITDLGTRGLPANSFVL